MEKVDFSKGYRNPEKKNGWPILAPRVSRGHFHRGFLLRHARQLSERGSTGSLFFSDLDKNADVSYFMFSLGSSTDNSQFFSWRTLTIVVSVILLFWCSWLQIHLVTEGNFAFILFVYLVAGSSSRQNGQRSARTTLA